MENFWIYSLAFICIIYAVVSAIVFRRRIVSDPFHPGFIYKLLIPFVLVYPIFSSEQVFLFSIETKALIIVTAWFFLVVTDFAWLSIKQNSASSVNSIFEKNTSSDLLAGKIFLSVYFLGWAWRLYALKAGYLHGTFLATQLEVTAYGNFVGQLNGISLLAFLGYLMFCQSSRLKPFMMVLVAIELIWTFLSGSKIGIFYVLIPVAMIAFHRRWLLLNTKLVVISIVGGLIAIQLSFILVTAYRLGVHKAIGSGQSLSLSVLTDSVGEAFSSFLIADEKHVSTESGGVGERLNLAAFYGALAERDDLLENLWWGKSYLPTFIWWIPRVVWPEKPTVSIGAWYGEQVLGWNYGTRSEGAITIFGDALINFGVPGVFVITIVWVFGLFYFYNRFAMRSKWGMLLLASIYVRLFLGIEQNLAATAVMVQSQILVIFIFWCVISFLSSNGSRKV